MNKDFPRIITLLRKEKKLSQKQVAADLEISQALLSHYEKGIRECGLDFIVKVAEYYDVSCDYLLGKTPQRYSDITDMSDDIAQSKKASVTQIINKRLISNSLSVLYDYLIKIGNRKLSNSISNYLMLAIYKMFRIIYSANKNNPQNMFAISESLYSGYSSSAMQIISTRITDVTSNEKSSEYIKSCSQISISPDIIADEYPLLASSLFNVIQHAESNLKNYKK